MTEALVGGTLIGCAAVWLFLSTGRIAGISGIAASALKTPVANSWAVFFLVGLGLGGLAAMFFIDVQIARNAGAITPGLLVGGVLVGFGTRLGSGCTSGHGVCGIARFSLRSVLATVIFLAFGMLTATGLYA
jgi:uncharacterized membrane protein YedE/YeeE